MSNMIFKFNNECMYRCWSKKQHDYIVESVKNNEALNIVWLYSYRDKNTKCKCEVFLLNDDLKEVLKSYSNVINE